MKVVLIILLTVIFPFTSFAQPLPSEKPPVFNIKCDDITTPAAQMGCVSERLLFARHMLNQVYSGIQNKLADRSSLSASQTSWVLYRDQACKFHASFEEDAYQRIKELECVSKLTEDRTLFLYNLQGMVEEQHARREEEHKTITLLSQTNE